MTGYLVGLVAYATALVLLTAYHLRRYRRDARSSRHRVELLVHEDRVRSLRAELDEMRRRLAVLTEGLASHPEILPGIFFSEDSELAALRAVVIDIRYAMRRAGVVPEEGTQQTQAPESREVHD
jgi:hypothetical protein